MALAWLHTSSFQALQRHLIWSHFRCRPTTGRSFRASLRSSSEYRTSGALLVLQCQSCDSRDHPTVHETLCVCANRQFLEAEVKDFPPERPVYLLGESFGGILAIAVASSRPDLINRLILVNPATSYERSMWPVLGPLLPQVPKVSRLRCRASIGVEEECTTSASARLGQHAQILKSCWLLRLRTLVWEMLWI